MRIITGSARGAKLSTLEGEDVRPTTDRVKQALFNIVQFQIEGRNVLDLFAGSGQLGLEAVSRGAKCAVLVDTAQNAIDVILGVSLATLCNYVNNIAETPINPELQAFA